MSNEAATGLRTTSDVLRLASVALPEPFAMIARLLSAAAGGIAVLVDEGKTEAQCIAEIRRVTHLDTSAFDAATDQRIEERRRVEREAVERAARGDEVTRETAVEGPGKR